MERIERAPECPYCGGKSERATGREVYPHRKDLAERRFYRCEPCGAYVGCHPGTWKPLGRLADAALRSAKMDAHAAFDPIWQQGMMSRSGAYRWLAEGLLMARDKCHIGLFDIEQCRRVVQLSKTYRGRHGEGRKWDATKKA